MSRFLSVFGMLNSCCHVLLFCQVCHVWALCHLSSTCPWGTTGHMPGMLFFKYGIAGRRRCKRLAKIEGRFVCSIGLLKQHTHCKQEPQVNKTETLANAGSKLGQKKGPAFTNMVQPFWQQQQQQQQQQHQQQQQQQQLHAFITPNSDATHTHTLGMFSFAPSQTR